MASKDIEWRLPKVPSSFRVLGFWKWLDAVAGWLSLTSQRDVGKKQTPLQLGRCVRGSAVCETLHSSCKSPGVFPCCFAQTCRLLVLSKRLMSDRLECLALMLRGNVLYGGLLPREGLQASTVGPCFSLMCDNDRSSSPVSLLLDLPSKSTVSWPDLSPAIARVVNPFSFVASSP